MPSTGDIGVQRQPSICRTSLHSDALDNVHNATHKVSMADITTLRDATAIVVYFACSSSCCGDECCPGAWWLFLIPV